MHSNLLTINSNYVTNQFTYKNEDKKQVDNKIDKKNINENMSAANINISDALETTNLNKVNSLEVKKTNLQEIVSFIKNFISDTRIKDHENNYSELSYEISKLKINLKNNSKQLPSEIMDIINDNYENLF